MRRAKRSLSLIAGGILLTAVWLVSLAGLVVSGWFLSVSGAESRLNPASADLAVILAVPEQPSTAAASFPWLRLSLSGANIPVRLCQLDTRTDEAELADKAWDQVLTGSMTTLAAETGLLEQQILIIGIDLSAGHLLKTVASLNSAGLFMVNPADVPLAQAGRSDPVDPADMAGAVQAAAATDDQIAAWAADLAAVWPSGRSLNLFTPRQQQGGRLPDPLTTGISTSDDDSGNLSANSTDPARIWEIVFEYITGEDISLFPGLQTKGLVKSESWLSTDGSSYLAEYDIPTTGAPLLSAGYLDGLTARILDFLPANTAATAGPRQLSALQRVYGTRLAGLIWIMGLFLLPVILAFLLLNQKRTRAAEMLSQAYRPEPAENLTDHPSRLRDQPGQAGWSDDANVRPVNSDRQKKTERFLPGPIFLIPAVLLSGLLSWLWPAYLSSAGLTGTPGFVLLTAFFFALVFNSWWLLTLVRHRPRLPGIRPIRLVLVSETESAVTDPQQQDFPATAADEEAQARHAQRRQLLRDLLLVFGLFFTLMVFVGSRILLGTWFWFAPGLVESVVLVCLLFPLHWIDAGIGVFMGQRRSDEPIDRRLPQGSWVLFGLSGLYLLLKVLFIRPTAWPLALLLLLLLLGCKGFNRLLSELTLRPWLSAVLTTALSFLVIGLIRLV